MRLIPCKKILETFLPVERVTYFNLTGDKIMDIAQQLEQVENTTQKALEHIEAGEFKKALNCTKSLKGLHTVSEATRAETIIKGYIFYKKRKNRKAREICINNMCYLWNDPDGLFLLRQSNPCINTDSRLFDITIKGGCAGMGPFTVFSPDHISDFRVVANDEFEAIRYIEEIANYQEGDKKTVLECTKQVLEVVDEYDKRGVYYTSPFRL